MNVPLLAAKTPCEVEGRNFRRGYREPQIGKVYTIHFEVEKELWDACELIPKTATIKGVIWWQPEFIEPKVEDKPESAKEPKGEHGEYWRRLRIWPIWTYPDLLEILDCTADADQVWQSLHAQLKTTSVTLVSPTEFEAWLIEHELEGLVNVSRQVLARIQEAEVK